MHTQSPSRFLWILVDPNSTYQQESAIIAPRQTQDAAVVARQRAYGNLGVKQKHANDAILRRNGNELTVWRELDIYTSSHSKLPATHEASCTHSVATCL